MNTYFTHPDPAATARDLDQQRLGKQRLEANQIGRHVLGLTAQPGWRNHPIVRAWRPYPHYLIRVYLPAIMAEWERRGYKNEKMADYLRLLSEALPKTTNSKPLAPPPWITPELIRSHRSYLIRRLPNYYRPMWPDVPADLPLIWPA